ncbi:MAG TPA: hypothetical protein VEA58_02155 [Anaerovoracaceae bacterium]|nr:hypothetical protein [Anaerovoracaceae bacterium]
MEKEAVDKLLELDKDELVLWSGNPEPFKIMDQYYKPALIRNYLITITIAVLVFAAALISNAAGGEINLVALAIVCGFPMVIIPAGQSQFSNYGKRCKYFFTNKNIIISMDSRQLKLPIDEISKVDSVTQSEGTVSIRIGKAAGLPIKKNRDYALKCLNQDAAEMKNKGGLLYNLSEKDAVTVLGLIDKYRIVA